MGIQWRLTRTYRLLVRGTTINEKTLLATDYLNHFNEVVMLLELIPDMPEMIEEAAEWQPNTYAEHFRASVFTEKELAIWAFLNAPEESQDAFEALVELANEQVLEAVEKVQALVTNSAGEEELRFVVMDRIGTIKKTLEQISAVITGAEISEVGGGLDQSAIDDLFA